MKLIVGLGNPGPEHEMNRHNVGFKAVDVVAAFYEFSGFKAKHQGMIAQGDIGQHKAIILKPTTYMNLSGQAVASVCQFFKIGIEDVVVIYDDIDLNPGQIKAKQGGGHGGHNGLRNIQAHLGPNYWRIRLGVGHPGDKSRVSGFVLGNFGKTEWEILEPLLDDVARYLPSMLNTDPGLFLNKIALNRK